MSTLTVTDKNTYAGQYANKKKFQKKMDFAQKERIRVLHIQLGTLLSQKKALNSKVTSRYFEMFRECVESGADPYDIKNRLNRLEQALKQEGLFKNVKGDFVHLKKEIMGLLYSSESQPPKSTLPGITLAKDKTFYVAAPKAADAEPTMVTSIPKYAGGSLSTDDMRILNSAIGKLYRHLQINSKEQQETMRANEFRDESSQKENVNILTLSHMQPEETFHDMVLKIKNFEKEFQRQKVHQQREQKKLQEEVKRLNKNTNELRRENERMKGIQPIASKAKGKQVERIEERYRNERKGMEEKINELETGLKSKFEQLSTDKEEFREHVRNDIDSLVSSINNIHYMVLGHTHDNRTINHRHYDDNEILPTKQILAILTSVAGGVQVMKSKNTDLEKDKMRKTEDISAWRRGMKELDREITRFSKTFASTTDDREPTHAQFGQDDDPDTLAFSCKSKLQKTKDNINTRLKGITDASSVIKRKERDITKYKRNTEDLQAEISKLHDQVLAAQRQDISITMPTFDRRHDNSDGSADELPEADQLEQNDTLDKIKQIGTMVTHFQKVIADRTNILNKMENDMLPLKIRVNRLHEEISKSVNTGKESPDPGEDVARIKRAFSPDNPSNMFSKEISTMLAKLSKMELTIRHLIEQHVTNDGRASI